MNWKVVSLTLGIWGLISYLVCIGWCLVTPPEWHMSHLLETLLPGFIYLSWPMFLLGLIESFLPGSYAGLVLAPTYNWVKARFAAPGG